MSAQAGVNAGDVVAERYRLVRPLGEGGMGTVHLARHLMTGRRVALKLVPASDAMTRERVLREARSMGRLSHPNVVGVLDMGEWNGRVFLATEYIHGKNLRQFARDKTPLSPSEAIDLLLPACNGVAAAHQAGILHRDLKPDNLFVCTERDGTPFDTKVLDFGVAKHLDEGDENLSLTDSGAIVGTPKYMAPEQVGSEPTLDARTDVYGLGLILYELLAGQLPYDTSGLRNVVMAILRGDLRPLHEAAPDVPRELSDVVMKALAGDLEERYPDVAAFARAIEPWAGSRRFVQPREVHTPEASKSGLSSWMPPPLSDSPDPLSQSTTRREGVPTRPLSDPARARDSDASVDGEIEGPDPYGATLADSTPPPVSEAPTPQTTTTRTTQSADTTLRRAIVVVLVLLLAGAVAKVWLSRGGRGERPAASRPAAAKVAEDRAAAAPAKEAATSLQPPPSAAGPGPEAVGTAAAGPGATASGTEGTGEDTTVEPAGGTDGEPAASDTAAHREPASDALGPAKPASRPASIRPPEPTRARAPAKPGAPTPEPADTHPPTDNRDPWANP